MSTKVGVQHHNYLKQNVKHQDIYQPYKEDKTVPGAGIILFRFILCQIQICLVKGKKGKYSFPKGCRQLDDKTELDNALRELHEESGVKPYMIDVYDNIIPEKKHKIDNTGKSYIKVNSYFPGLLKQQFNNTQLKCDFTELTSVGWYTLENAKSMLSDRYQMVETALKYIDD